MTHSTHKIRTQKNRSSLYKHERYFLVRHGEFESPTFWSVARRSIQLS